MQLFQSEENDANNGNILSFSPQRTAASSLGKQDAPTPKQTGKRQDTTTSPLRSILNGAAAFVNQITQTQPWTVIHPPLDDTNTTVDDASPTSVLDTLFSEVADDMNPSALAIPGRSHAGMIGFVPKSAILRFVGEDSFDTNIVYTPDEIKN